jgi:hypothetical protein
MEHRERLKLLRKMAKTQGLVSSAMSKDERTVPILAKSLFRNLKNEGATPNEMMELVGTLMDLIAEDLRSSGNQEQNI